jgi:hypothetical protein
MFYGQSNRQHQKTWSQYPERPVAIVDRDDFVVILLRANYGGI